MAMRDDIITAVQNYFSSDSDIYKKVMSGQGLTLGEMNAILSSVPYMKPVTSISGSRLGFDANVPFKDVDVDRQIVQDLFDSNYGGSSYGGSFSGNIPGNFSYDAGTGRYTAISGAKDSLGNIVPVVADKLSLGVTGVNIGAKFGLAIDKALYENFPDFWNNVFGDVSPSDFEKLFSEDTFGNKFMRTLFGIKDNGVTTYVPEEAISLVYQALRDAGVFKDGVITPVPEVPTGSGVRVPIVTGPLSNFVNVSNTDAAPYASNTATALVGVRPTITFGIKSNNPNVDFNVNRTVTRLNNGTYMVSPAFPIDMAFNTDGVVVLGSNGISRVANSQNVGIAVYASTFSPSVTGVSRMPNERAPYGSPDPSIIDGSDSPTILNQLKQNYPDLFQDPITITTPQPDGSLRTMTYYPTPWASSTPSLVTDYEVNPQQQTEPTTKPDTTQDDDTLTDEEIEDIIPAPTPDPVIREDVEPSPDPTPSPDPAPYPDAPTVPPTDTTPPDTGEGENEPSPVPVGEENAMWAVYNPSNSALSQFGAWLWSPNFIDNILRLFQSPIDGVIGIHKIFVTPPRGGAQNIVVGYLDSGVSSITVPTQYTELNCGSVNLPEYFGNVFDYAPYTEVFIYLPFIGITKLNVADVMRSKITVKYRVDVYTGACLAMITVKRDGFSPIMYTYAGDCAVHYPISAGSYSGIISSVISAGVSALASGVATGGNPAMGAVAAGATFLTHNKGLSVEHSGGLSGNSGAMGPKKPYLIIKRPQPRMAVDAEVYDGIPANYTTAIGSCTGYIKCKSVHLKAPGAYQNELDEIEQLLKSGILVTDD